MILGYHNKLKRHDLPSYDPGFATLPHNRLDGKKITGCPASVSSKGS